MADRAIVSASQVFTPSTPARLTFVERTPEVNNDLVDALRTPGKQIVVYGHSGSGKTTLLVNLLARTYEDHIRIICDRNTSMDDILRETLERLETSYIASRQTASSRKKGAKIKAKVRSAEFEVSGEELMSESVIRHPVIVPQATPQRVAEQLGARHCCLLLEDFYKLAPDEKARMSDVMKVFVDVALMYDQVKLIATGAVGSAREVVEFEPAMRTRVAEILVPLMTRNELREILKNGERILNVRFSPVVIDSILEYSGGLGAVCHQLALNACSAAGIEATMQSQTRIQVQHLTQAVRKYLASSSDSLKLKFDRAFKRERHGRYDNCRVILSALSGFPQEGATRGQLLQSIHETLPDYPSGNLAKYLKDLQNADRGEIVVFDQAANAYSFADPLDRAFMMLLTSRSESPQARGPLPLSAEVMERIINELSSLYLRHLSS